MRENIYNLSRPSEQISGSSKIIVDSKNNISDEQLEISVKTFFGHELKVIANADGSYSITTKGLKGLIDKILLPIFSKELDTRKAEIEKSLKNNNAPVFDEGNKSKDQNVQSLGRIDDPQNPQFSIKNPNKGKKFDSIVNKAIERAKKELNLSEKEYSEIMATISVFKGNEFTEDGMFSFVKDTIIQLREKVSIRQIIKITNQNDILTLTKETISDIKPILIMVLKIITLSKSAQLITIFPFLRT